MFQASFLSLAVVLTLSSPPSQAAALPTAESTWPAAVAAVPWLAFARAQQLHLSCAHKV